MFSKAGKLKTSMVQVPYNKLLTNLASLSRTNLLLTEREGRTGEYWPEVVAVRTERSKVRTETTEGQYSPVWLELARLVSSLLYGIRAILVLNLPAFKNKKYTAYDRFHGNGPYGEIPTKKEPIRTLGFALPCNNKDYWPSVVFVRTSLGLVRIATTSGQYSPVRPSRSVSKRLLLLRNATASGQHAI